MFITICGITSRAAESKPRLLRGSGSLGPGVTPGTAQTCAGRRAVVALVKGSAPSGRKQRSSSSRSCSCRRLWRWRSQREPLSFQTHLLAATNERSAPGITPATLVVMMTWGGGGAACMVHLALAAWGAGHLAVFVHAAMRSSKSMRMRANAPHASNGVHEPHAAAWGPMRPHAVPCAGACGRQRPHAAPCGPRAPAPCCRAPPSSVPGSSQCCLQSPGAAAPGTALKM